MHYCILRTVPFWINFRVNPNTHLCNFDEILCQISTKYWHLLVTEYYQVLALYIFRV